MIVRHLQSVNGTDRDVVIPTGRSRRLLLAGDGQPPYSLHDTVLHAGTETVMWYVNHVETVYITEGTGTLFNDETGDVYGLEPGVVYVLDGHEHHRLRAETDIRCVCVFTPPLVGPEVHDETGAFPLLTEVASLHAAVGSEPS